MLFADADELLKLDRGAVEPVRVLSSAIKDWPLVQLTDLPASGQTVELSSSARGLVWNRPLHVYLGLADPGMPAT
jgi:hypothetical protein